MKWYKLWGNTLIMNLWWKLFQKMKNEPCSLSSRFNRCRCLSAKGTFWSIIQKIELLFRYWKTPQLVSSWPINNFLTCWDKRLYRCRSTQVNLTGPEVTAVFNLLHWEDVDTPLSKGTHWKQAISSSRFYLNSSWTLIVSSSLPEITKNPVLFEWQEESDK